MQLLTELLDIDDQNSLFLTENIGKLKDLGLGRMINAFKQSFSLSGHGSTARLNQTNVGAKILSRATGIGPNSQVVDGGNVRNWPHLRREIINNLADPGVAAILFKIDEKPVALVALGPQWSITNAKAVVGMAWDFTNASGSDQEVQSVLNGLSIKRKSAKKGEEEKKQEVPLRMYQGHVQTMDQMISFVKAGVNSFGNRFDYSFITPEPDPKKAKDKGVKEDIDQEGLLDLLFEESDKKSRTKLSISKINTVLLTPKDAGFEHLQDKVYGVRNEDPIIDALLELLGVPEDGTPYKIRNGFMKYEKNSKMLFIAKFKSDLPGVKKS